MVVALLVIGELLNRAGFKIDIVERLAAVTVVLLLVVYAGVIISCLKLRGEGETDQTFRAPTPLLLVGLIGNLVLLYYVIVDDPASLLWCAGLVAVGHGAVRRGVLRRHPQPAGGRRARRPGEHRREGNLRCTSSSPRTGPSSRLPPPGT